MGGKLKRERIYLCKLTADSPCCRQGRNQHSILEQLYSNKKYIYIYFFIMWFLILYERVWLYWLVFDILNLWFLKVFKINLIYWRRYPTTKWNTIQKHHSWCQNGLNLYLINKDKKSSMNLIKSSFIVKRILSLQKKMVIYFQ